MWVCFEEVRVQVPSGALALATRCHPSKPSQASEEPLLILQAWIGGSRSSRRFLHASREISLSLETLPLMLHYTCGHCTGRRSDHDNMGSCQLSWFPNIFEERGITFLFSELLRMHGCSDA